MKYYATTKIMENSGVYYDLDRVYVLPNRKKLKTVMNDYKYASHYAYGSIERPLSMIMKYGSLITGGTFELNGLDAEGTGAIYLWDNGYSEIYMSPAIEGDCYHREDWEVIDKAYQILEDKGLRSVLKYAKKLAKEKEDSKAEQSYLNAISFYDRVKELVEKEEPVRKTTEGQNNPFENSIKEPSDNQQAIIIQQQEEIERLKNILANMKKEKAIRESRYEDDGK